MENIFVFLSIVILIECAVIPQNQIEDTILQHKIISSTEPVQDYTNIETAHLQDSSNNRNGDQLKRCSDYDIISSSYQPDAVLALSRREINLLERNRERCENCRNNPICKNDIARCRTCKRICDSVAEQMRTTTTTTTESPDENNIPTDLPEPILGQQQQQFNPNEITMRFGEDSTTSYPKKYFSIGSVQTGPTMDLIAKLFNVDNRDELEQFIILGKLKQDDDGDNNNGMIKNNQTLFIWDLGNVFKWKDNQPTPTEIHNIANYRIDDNNKKIDLAQELNEELDKAIRNKKKELGQSKLSRQEIDNLINATMTEIMERHNDTVGCSLEEEFQPIYLRNKPDNLHKTSISNPPLIQNSFEPKLGAKTNLNKPIITQPVDTVIDDKIVGETLLTSTEAQPLPESDNQINNLRDNYDSNEDSSSSSESNEESYVGANQEGNLKGISNLRNLIQNAPIPDITKIVEDSLKIPNNFRQTGDNRLNSEPPKNLEQEVQKIVEDSLKVHEPTDNIVGQQSPNLPTRNKIDGNSVAHENIVSLEPSKNLQGEVEKIIGDNLKTSEPAGNIVAQQTSDLPTRNKIEENPVVNLEPSRNLQEEVEKLIGDSLKMSEPADNVAAEQNTNLLNNEVENLEPLKTVQEEVKKLVEDSVKVHEPTDNIVGQQSPNLPTRIKIEEPRLVENPLHQTAPAQGTKTMKTVKVAPYEGMPVDENPKVFPYHLARPFTQLPTLSTIDDGNPTINQVTTPTTVMENKLVDSPILENRGELSNIVGKFNSFGSLIPIPGQNGDNPNIRNVYFLGKDIALPLQMHQDRDGSMQLSVDMEKLCNCKNKTCIKTHKNLEEFGNNFLKNIETQQNQGNFKKTSDIMKRSPKIENFPKNDKQFEENDNYLELEEKLNKLHKVVEKFEQDNENLLEESTKVLLKNVENEGKVQKTVDLINKMLKWMKNVVTETQKSK